MLVMLFLLLVSHALCDFALQNDYIAQAKNKHTVLGKDVWGIVLTSHALIHSGGVYVVTQSMWAALFQFITHWIIDYKKCDNDITYVQDQKLHALVMFITALFFI